MKHALTQKLAGVAAWKWLAGLTGAIVLYRRFQGSGGSGGGGGATAPPASTDTSTGYTDAGYPPDTGYVEGYQPGATPTTDPLSPEGNPGGPEQPAPAGTTTKPPGKRKRSAHKPAHHAKGHKQKPEPGAHRGGQATRKRTSHAKAQPTRTRSHATAHPAAHPTAKPPAKPAAHKTARSAPARTALPRTPPPASKPAVRVAPPKPAPAPKPKAKRK